MRNKLFVLMPLCLYDLIINKLITINDWSQSNING